MPIDPARPAPSELAALATANQASWFAAAARALGGSESGTPLGRMTRIPATEGAADGEVRIVTLTPLDDSPLDIGSHAGDIVDAARDDASIASVGWWAGDISSNRSLGASLLARGASWGFQPGWMHLDTARADTAVPAIPDVSVSPVMADVAWDAPDLPYYDRRLGRSFARLVAEQSDGTRSAVFHATTAEGRVIGLIVVHAQATESGRRVAGIYHCGVEPQYQRRGIGRALTATAARWAIEHGCTDVTLNATPMGARVYPSVGFRHVGGGQTWWLFRETLDRGPSPAAEIRLVEAIGRGTLDELPGEEVAALDLDALLSCGRTAVEIAALLRHEESARRLAGLGATVDLISAWDLGWRDEIPGLLRGRPDLVDRRGGEHLATPLQVAVERNDRGLFDLLISANPDLTIVDRTFGATALDWARHIGRPGMVEALRRRE